MSLVKGGKDSVNAKKLNDWIFPARSPRRRSPNGTSSWWLMAR
jgi:hypothetical protein